VERGSEGGTDARESDGPPFEIEALSPDDEAGRRTEGGAGVEFVESSEESAMLRLGLRPARAQAGSILARTFIPGS